MSTTDKLFATACILILIAGLLIGIGVVKCEKQHAQRIRDIREGKQ